MMLHLAFSKPEKDRKAVHQYFIFGFCFFGNDELRFESWLFSQLIASAHCHRSRQRWMTLESRGPRGAGELDMTKEY